MNDKNTNPASDFAKGTGKVLGKAGLLALKGLGHVAKVYVEGMDIKRRDDMRQRMEGVSSYDIPLAIETLQSRLPKPAPVRAEPINVTVNEVHVVGVDEPTHFAPYGQDKTSCNILIPITTPWDVEEGNWVPNVPFTVRRKDTTCEACKANFVS